MKNFKKVLAYGLVAIMTLGLAACSSSDKDDDDDDDDKDSKKEDKKVTAESLLEDIPSEELKSLTANMKFDIDIDMDLKQMMLDMGATEDDIEEGIASGEITEDQLAMSIILNMDVDIEAEDDYTYMSGQMEMEAMGQEETTKLESYLDTTDEDTTVTYEYSEEDDTWYVSEEAADEDSPKLNDMDAMKDYIKEPEIKEETDDEYVLSIVIDVKKLADENPELAAEFFGVASDSTDEILGDSSEMFESIEELEFTMGIDKETNYPSSLAIDMADILTDIMTASEDEDSSAYADYITINEFAFEMTFDKYNETEVEIPEDVIENAVEAPIDEDDDSDDDWTNDDDSVVVNGNTFDILDYDGNSLATITIPEGFTVDDFMSDPTSVWLEDDNYNSIYVDYEPYYWIEEFITDGTYEPDLEFYTRDELVEGSSIETAQGTVKVIAEIQSTSDDYENEYDVCYYFVLMNEDGTMPTISAYDTTLDELDTSAEDLIKEMLQ